MAGAAVNDVVTRIEKHDKGSSNPKIRR